MNRIVLSFLFLCLPVGSAVVGCGSDDTQAATSSGAGGGGDGKYHPKTNGMHASEDSACQMLTSAYAARFAQLSCGPLTSSGCPYSLRAEFMTACMEYDLGSVQGCVGYYNQQPSCDALKQSLADCVITPYPGTEPKGCPTP